MVRGVRSADVVQLRAHLAAVEPREPHLPGGLLPHRGVGPAERRLEQLGPLVGADGALEDVEVGGIPAVALARRRLLEARARPAPVPIVGRYGWSASAHAPAAAAASGSAADSASTPST